MTKSARCTCDNSTCHDCLNNAKPYYFTFSDGQCAYLPKTLPVLGILADILADAQE